MKKLIIPFLSIVALPTSIQANIDPKIAEICMKATDFQGCVKSMSVKKTDNLNINPNFDNTLTLFKNGDYLNASKAINTFLKKNSDSKEGWMLRAIIHAYGFAEFEDAVEAIDKAIEIDNEYALAYALKADLYYFDLGGSYSRTLKYLERAINISPEDPYINLIAGFIESDNGFIILEDGSYELAKMSRGKKDLALKFFENAKNNYEIALANMKLGTNKNPLGELLFVLDAIYSTNAELGNTKYELSFLYRDKRERQTAKKYLEEAVQHYTTALSLAPSQEDVEEIELDRDMYLWSPAEVYLNRGNAYSWLNNKWQSACRDWKASKKLGNRDAQDIYRENKC